MKTSDVNSEAVTHESEGARTLRASELLRKAADEIRRRGWHQGDYGSDYSVPETCAVCSVGAISAATSGSPWLPTSTSGNQALCILTDAINLEDVVPWNDAEGRTVEEVLDAFERAAVAAEGEGGR